MKGLIAFVVLVLAPIIFWIGETGLNLLQAGYGWIAIFAAPLQAAIFAFIVSGKPGKGLVKTDDQGHVLIGRFWGVFIFLTVILIGIALLLINEA